ncbi:MAG: hypothetical protein WCY93_12230 [Anaerolineaceae bacterium]
MDAKTYRSAVEGLMLLGRTREEAVKELNKNEDRRYRKMEAELWDYDPSKDK